MTPDELLAATPTVLPSIKNLPGIPSWIDVEDDTEVEERTPPTMSQKIAALFDFWTFCDILHFHGGSEAFSACHTEVWNWHVRPNASLRQLIIESRGMLKSTIFSVGRTLWRIYQNPNIRLFVGCETLKLSHAFIREVKASLEDEWLQEHVWNSRPHIKGPLIPVMDKLGKARRYEKFGDTTAAEDKKVVWRADAIQVLRTKKLKEPTLVAGAVGATATGFHYDEVIFDDVVTFDNVATMDKIDRVFSWIYDIESVLDPPRLDQELLQHFYKCCPEHFDKLARWCISGGRVTVVGTRYDEADYYGHVIANQEDLQFDVWQKNIYVNGRDNSDGYRWPEVWNEQLELLKRAQLEKRHGGDGVRRWYSQYLNSIVNPQDVKAEWDKIHWVQGNYYRYIEKLNVVRVYDGAGEDATTVADVRLRICVDPAATAKKKSDLSTIAVGGIGTNGKLYVFDFWMRKADSTKWIPQVYKYSSKWNCMYVSIESVAFSNELFNTFRLAYFDKYWPLHLNAYTPSNQMSKVDRIENSLYVAMHNELVCMATYISQDRELKRQIQFLRKATINDDGPDVLNQLYEVSKPPARKSDKRAPRKPRYKVGGRYGGYNYA
jgi:hypothetical protein